MPFHIPFLGHHGHDHGGQHDPNQGQPNPNQGGQPNPNTSPNYPPPQPNYPPPGNNCPAPGSAGQRKPSPPGQGDIIGAVTAGYQGWFTCDGDGSPLRGWWHWAKSRLDDMKCDNCAIISWPDMRYYEKQHPTSFAACPNGTPARLFSSLDAQTVYAHFRMMQDAEINTAALQRFVPCGPEGPPRDIVTVHVANAALATGVKWYCMYDVGGWKKMRTELPMDWQTKMSQYVNSPVYARQNGKPVVSIWGFGFNDDNHPFTPEECLEVIRWLQSAGCYVIGGVPTWWRKGISDSRDNYHDVYRAFDCISPWMVGRASRTQDLDHYFRECNRPDVEELHALGIDYQPCVMPGDLATGRRKHGDFYWHHFHNLSKLGNTGVGLYVSMFDEYNEGHHIAPTAETKADQPADFPHPALDEDGVACTADYYLRLTKDGGAMFKGRLPMTPLRPTEPWPGKGPQHSNRNVHIKAMVNGKYVCAERGGGGNLINNREKAAGWETFEIEQARDGSGKVHIKTQNGKYVCAVRDDLVANRDKAGPWETFELVQADDGRVMIKAWTGKFVTASPDGTKKLGAGAAEAGWWESFGFEEA